MYQLPLFADNDSVQIEIAVIEFNGIFQASILGGWWVASGKTRQAAIKKVMSLYERENELYGPV